MKNLPSSAQLSPGWVDNFHPTIELPPYTPKPVDFDDSLEGDFAHGAPETDAGLRRIARASLTEAERLERAYR